MKVNVVASSGFANTKVTTDRDIFIYIEITIDLCITMKSNVFIASTILTNFKVATNNCIPFYSKITVDVSVSVNLNDIIVAGVRTWTNDKVTFE